MCLWEKKGSQNFINFPTDKWHLYGGKKKFICDTKKVFEPQDLSFFDTLKSKFSRFL